MFKCLFTLVMCNMKYFILDNVKIGNLKRKNRDHKKVPKQDEDAGNSVCKFYYI